MKKNTRSSEQKKENVEMPLTGVLKQYDYGDAVSFLIVCDCSDPECSHRLTVEVDQKMFTVSVESKVTTPFWSKNRWRSIFELLFKGYTTYYSDIILTEKAAKNYSNVLTMSVENAKKYIANTKT